MINSDIIKCKTVSVNPVRKTAPDSKPLNERKNTENSALSNGVNGSVGVSEKKFLCSETPVRLWYFSYETNRNIASNLDFTRGDFSWILPGGFDLFAQWQDC